MPIGQPKSPSALKRTAPKKSQQPEPEHVEECLDCALDDSFPASDPPSMTQPGGQRSLRSDTKAE